MTIMIVTAQGRKNFYGSLHIVLISSLMLSGCAKEEAEGQDKKNQPASQSIYKEVGEASWYGPGFHGRETASGEVFDQKGMTAAHPRLPLGTEVEVTNLENKKKVEVEITDRGPYVKDRIIDLSKEAAKKLDMKEDGISKVKIEATEPVKKESPNKAEAKQTDEAPAKSAKQQKKSKRKKSVSSSSAKAK
ncbi:septal ring lytic transglycosylase RlpA family protein [Methylobacter sp. YRD-M1]|uniref:septal ring lytic transglycosylase RlpA family protein n=1 Tax=Methylobacter sp. YRD-M1 TaxID=2911520 RepID=UPI00227D6A24|nr:septal ring lytic transglycosylase RlpA family protein [Methylobacter sp. YRD-M1]WAK03905.1 septal ring lytic transglycosylase RlpA family protein [Methylobacter sp. YRD-M1]